MSCRQASRSAATAGARTAAGARVCCATSGEAARHPSEKNAHRRGVTGTRLSAARPNRSTDVALLGPRRVDTTVMPSRNLRVHRRPVPRWRRTSCCDAARISFFHCGGIYLTSSRLLLHDTATSQAEQQHFDEIIRNDSKSLQLTPRQLQQTARQEGRAKACLQTRQCDLAIADYTEAISLQLRGFLMLIDARQSGRSIQSIRRHRSTC
jgi:hypothetical protein